MEVFLISLNDSHCHFLPWQRSKCRGPSEKLWAVRKKHVRSFTEKGKGTDPQYPSPSCVPKLMFLSRPSFPWGLKHPP